MPYRSQSALAVGILAALFVAAESPAADMAGAVAADAEAAAKPGLKNDAPAPAPARPAARSRKKAAKARAGRRAAVADEPPDCPHRKDEGKGAGAAPAPTSMPEMFARMGETFAANPATGFPNFVKDLSRYEGPAMEGITLSLAEERRAGQTARAEYLAQAARKGCKVVNDPAKLRYLRDLVATIAPRMKNRERYKDLDITLIDAPQADGQTFPGGYLVFTTGLLKEPDEATVIAVVAHELAHLDRGHMYEYARRSKLAESTFASPSDAPSPAAFDRFFTKGMALFGLMMNPFRPEHELEADCTAVTWLYQEGYDPHALVGFFERLHRDTKDVPADSFFSFWRTHPYSLDRRRHVLERLTQLERWHPRRDLGLFPDNLRRLTTHGRELAEKAVPEVKGK